MPLQVKKVQLKLKDVNEYKDGDLLFNVDAQAWTKGTRNGKVVNAPENSDNSYPHAENNAKYYAEQASNTVVINDQPGILTKIAIETTNEDIDILTTNDIDDTLSIEGSAADAKVTGEAVDDLAAQLANIYENTFEYKTYQKTFEVEANTVFSKDVFLHINAGQYYYIQSELETDIISGRINCRHILNETGTQQGNTFYLNQNEKQTFIADTDIYGFHFGKAADGILNDGNIKIILGIENPSSIEAKLNNAEDNIVLNSDDISDLQGDILNLSNDISYLQDADRRIESNISTINILYNNLNESKIKKPLTNPDGIEGQILRSLGNGNIEWSTFGTPTSEQIDAAVNTAVNTYLNDHPGSVTPILDDSITYDKFTDQTKLKIENNYVTPEMWGAVGNGNTDDLNAFNIAIAYALDRGITVKLTGGKTYYLSEGLVIPKGSKIKKLCMESDTIATIKVAYGFSPLIKIGSYTILKNIKFEAALNENNTSHYMPSNLHNLTGIWVAGSSCYLENITASMCYKGFYLCNDWIYGEGTRESCQFNKIIDCNAENCIIGLDIYADGREIEVDSDGKETVTASGFSNEHDIIRLKNTSTSTYTNLFRKHTEWGYDQEYFIYIRHSQDNPYANNCIRFIDCSFENAFNGVYAISSYCMFINCRTDNVGKYINKLDSAGNPVPKKDKNGNIIEDENHNPIIEQVFCPGKYYTFINENNNGSNIVLGGYSSAYRIINNQVQRSIEEIDMAGKSSRVNFILFNRYPFRASMLGFKDDPSMTLSNAISSDDAGIIAYGANLNPPRPIYWDGTKWRDFMGNLI